MNKSYTTFKTPLGQMTIQANEQGLLGAWFETQTTQPEELGKNDKEHPIPVSYTHLTLPTTR